jgi:hypothetical protein
MDENSIWIVITDLLKFRSNCFAWSTPDETYVNKNAKKIDLTSPQNKQTNRYNNQRRNRA